ncbi:cytochrome P450 94B3-like [Telopea speciosissima]|uniref:cytochrome P450 94B3-like n=1 Tax=Telopea speciosissima TaxID=54955 RepID=UPI001CC51DC6|nr:cytochrome P450 94B3-like [Telopea speciosissima]
MDIFSLQTLVVLFVSLRIYFYFSKKENPTIKTGFPSYPLVGTLLEFIKNRHRFLEWTTEILSHAPANTAVFRRPGKIHGVITANPLNIEYMLKTNFENYPKGDRFISLLEDFLGRGIFNSDGELWKLQRKTASFEFNTKSLRNFVMDIIKEETQSRLIPQLMRVADLDQIVDMQDVLERFAFDNMCKLAFNIDPGCLGGDANAGKGFMQAFEDAATLSAGRSMSALPHLWKLKKALNIGSEKQLKESISTVHSFADKIIRSRMEAKQESSADLLSRFMENESNSPELLRDIVISFILAGRDTTSSALTWLFWLLGSRLDVKLNILKELKAIRTRNGKEIGHTYSFDELREMQYLQAVISEAMRLYPPVPVDTKECLKDDVLPDGTLVAKGWFVSYNTYAMGRMESIWGKDCRKFKPERWLENGMCRQESPFRYPVFHAGPRICLGMNMAFIQMKSIAAVVLERFDMNALEKDTCPDYLLSLTLRMKGGLRVKLRERSVDDHYGV